MTTNYATPRPFHCPSRLNRVRYLCYMLLTSCIADLFSFLFSTNEVSADNVLQHLPLVLLSLVLGITVLVFRFIFTIQRCHDFNVSGWLSLLILIPLVPFIVFCCIPGSREENRFGKPLSPPSTGLTISTILLVVLYLTLQSIVIKNSLINFEQVILRAEHTQQQQYSDDGQWSDGDSDSGGAPSRAWKV